MATGEGALTVNVVKARAALLAVESSGRAAMAELRSMLGLLSPAPPGDPPPPGDLSSGGMPLAGGPLAAAEPALPGPPGGLRPQPGLRQLGPLVDRVAATGLPVEMHVSELPPGLPPGLDLAAFRVVQEALTNVIKHAGKPQTTVRADYQGGSLIVEVANAPAEPGAAAAPPMPNGAGRGLLGLRERVALYGGELDAGPRPGGGWRVRARIAVDPALAVEAARGAGEAARGAGPALAERTAAQP